MKLPTTSYQPPAKRGSALLIVLGMFAFMLVSAVAFSVYMRASRAPSSYLRRNTSVRQVVKAAVARAIDEVDTAIGNDPFPDVGYNHDYGGNGIQQGNRYKNDNWHGRVFTPSNEVAMADTVSTLTLEGLGYLPPCLVNEVRYWSRHTRTAKWHAFNYGLGRYAFTVVNVSDFFDLNNFITPASGVRHHYLNRSSSPHGRVSPTYLFRAGNESAMNGGGAAASSFLSAIATGSGIGNNPPVAQVPFVSLMDFNLSLLNNPIGGFATPFSKLIRDNNGSTFLSGLEDAARRTVFMAGGWNGGSNLTWNAYQTTGRINLRYSECQPFAGWNWVWDGNSSLSKSINVGRDHQFWKPIEPYIYPLTCALMCDYLDCDSVPVSLCIPSVEAVPMLCGVTLNPDCVKYTVSYVKGEPGPPDEAGKKTRIDTCKIKIDIDALETELTTVYPFASGSQGQSDNYKVESFARVFFVEDSTLSDDKLEDDGLRNNFFHLGDNFNWSVNNDNSRADYMQVKIANGTVKTSDYLQSGQGEALEKAAIKGNLGNNASLSKEVTVAELTIEIDDSGNERVTSANDPGQINFYPRDLSARVDFKRAFESAVETKYRPCVAVWTRIVDANGKTVDMAPAIPAYDNLNGFSENKGDIGFLDFNKSTGADRGAPAFRFFAKQADESAGIQPNQKYFKDQDGQEKKAQWKQTAYAANDPRYNWAPEHWYAQAAGNPTDFWFDNVKTFRDNHDWCDPDIFMSVSDQGYLQSMYEFMMLPQVGKMIDKQGDDCGELDLYPDVNYNGKVRLACGEVAHNGLMWRTYRVEAFRKDPGTWNLGYLEEMPFDEADNGLRVNPYTDVTNVMLGAFANMPLDWAAAGTNWNNNGMSNKDYMKPESSDFKNTDDYIFEWSYKYQDVYDMASFWMGLFRRTADANEREKLYGADGWQDVFDDHNIVYWRTGDVKESPPGVDVNRVEQILKDEMTSVDRKFLYGYLRGCFANTAQLFLVFVRAETTAGGAVGAGARAVALVWRDPAPPRDNAGNYVKATGGSENPQYGKDNAQQYLRPFTANGPEESWRFRTRTFPPHRTRVLFYHQFD